MLAVLPVVRIAWYCEDVSHLHVTLEVQRLGEIGLQHFDSNPSVPVLIRFEIPLWDSQFVRPALRFVAHSYGNYWCEMCHVL